MDVFSPKMNTSDVNKISMLGLAHVGDAVYELLVRTMLCAQGHSSVTELHRLTVSLVNAPAQASAAEKIMSALSEEELAIYRRGRNTKVNSVPHSADVGQYHAATGIEALFGWLYLQGRQERISDLFGIIMSEGEQVCRLTH